MPGALLIEKCKANLRAGCHPVIITIFERVHTALNLAEDADLGIMAGRGWRKLFRLYNLK